MTQPITGFNESTLSEEDKVKIKIIEDLPWQYDLDYFPMQNPQKEYDFLTFISS